MSLVPYKVTAITKTDPTGNNVLPLASVAIVKSGGGYAQLWDDEAGTIARANPFQVDANGERQVWLNGGEYNVSVAGGQSWDIKLTGGSDILSIENVAGLATLTPIVGQLYRLKEYNLGTGKGGGDLLAKSGVITPNNVTTFASATAGVYFERVNTVINSDHAGAKGDGVDDTAAISRLRAYCQSSGAEMILAAGVFTVSSSAAVTFTAPLKIRGSGAGKSTLRAADSAGMAEFVTYLSPVGEITIRDLTIDGNRGNGGIIASGGYCLYLSGYDSRISFCELKDSGFAGAFVGSSTGITHNHYFQNCWIHSNGAISVGGNGVGIFGGGSTPANLVSVESCTIENNYCIDTLPGDSTALNINAFNIIIEGNEVRNNYNVNGGQIAVTSYGTGSAKVNAIIKGNILDLNGTFGGDRTCGIEVNGSDFVVANNIVKNANVDAITIEGDSSNGIVSGNILYAGTVDGSCINIINSGGSSSGTNITLNHNKAMRGFNGVSLQTGFSNVYAMDNTIGSSVTNKIAGEANFKILRGNDGYAPASPDITASGSPWTSTAQPWDCLVVIKTPGGLTGLTFGGANLPITAGTSFFVKAQRQFIATWTGADPVFSFIQQQR